MYHSVEASPIEIPVESTFSVSGFFRLHADRFALAAAIISIVAIAIIH